MSIADIIKEGTADCIYEHIPGTYCPCHGRIR